MFSLRMTGVLSGAALLLIAQVGAAAYITDKLLAGFYSSPDLTAEPVRALPNGTPMEVLEESGRFTRIRLGDNSEGWVETRFVTQEKPAKTMLLELQAKYADLRRKLEAGGEGQPIESPAAASGGEAELQGQPVEAQQRDENSAQDSAPGITSEPTETAEQRQLRQEYAQLKVRIQRIRQFVSDAPETELHQRTDTFQPWILPLILLGHLLSFIAGIAFKNYRIVRRARQAGKPE
ncbi:MAG: TIGR04211 family SH3 domain-containing protein [Gammaproteobacteria bacterium]|nr:TIGR04211 family SH3 domain-containing protein [Gammaproteobacteria bacterium]HXK56078.1 TIGR04211 family SH3 domain-containing protein [Gammaproteobacteria bacterium]